MSTIDLANIDPKVLIGASKADLVRLAKDIAALKSRAGQVGPQTDDELHDFIKRNYGIHIPRNAVTEGHCAPFDFVADAYFQRETSQLVIANREGSKCVKHSTILFDAKTGLLRTIKEMVEDPRDEMVRTVDGVGRFHSVEPAARWATGRKECLRITTKSGRSISVTPEHPMLTPEGYVRADELEVGVDLASPAHMPTPAEPVRMDSRLVDLVAVLLAEGSYTAGAVGFSTADAHILDLMRQVEDVFDVAVKHEANYDYFFRTAPGTRNGLRQWMNSIGLGNEKAIEKTIPDCIFRLDREQLARFLAVFWMCDGFITDKEAALTLASEKMVRQIQHLLLRLGVQSRVAHRRAWDHNHKCFDAWHLVVYGGEPTANFCAWIAPHLWGDKRGKCDKLAAKSRLQKAGRPRITNELLSRLGRLMPRAKRGRGDGRGHDLWRRLGWSTEHVERPSAAPASVLKKGAMKTVSRRRLRELCHVHDVDPGQFALYLSDEIWWDPIVSIEPDGVHDVYDLTIDGTHNFVAADLVCHNTFSVGLVQVLWARFFPGYEGLTAGAVEYQTVRAYQAIRKLNAAFGKDQVADTQQSRTEWKNGSVVEILTMTYEAMNGPHTWFLHRDEVELARRNAFDEADNITRSGVTTDGRVFKAHDVLTSTRKLARGKVQELIDQCEEAEKNGHKPPYKIYKWGIAETVKRVPNCRYHMPEGTPEEELCPCPKYVNGFIGDPKDGVPRTLETVCGGRFGRSDGWRPLEPDVAGKFTKNSQAMWDAQHECKKPASEGLILTNYDETINGIRGYVPDPANGRIFNSSDFGGSNPFASHWYQLLSRDVQVLGFHGAPKVIPKGSLVCFDEVYQADIGNNAFFAMIVGKENAYRERFERWEIYERYADIAGRAERIDMRNYDPPLNTIWRIQRDVETHINTINERIDLGLLYVDVDKCPKWNEEAQAWQRDPKTGKEIDTFNHAMADLRYCAENIKRLLQIERKVRGGAAGLDTPDDKTAAKPIDLTKLPDTGPASSTLDERPPDIPLHRQPPRPGRIGGPHNPAAGAAPIMMDDIW